MDEVDFLIVDDDPAICELMKRVAKSCGFSAAAATDAGTFKDLYINNDVKVIVVDLPCRGLMASRYSASLRRQGANPIS